MDGTVAVTPPGGRFAAGFHRDRMIDARMWFCSQGGSLSWSPVLLHNGSAADESESKRLPVTVRAK